MRTTALFLLLGCLTAFGESDPSCRAYTKELRAATLDSSGQKFADKKSVDLVLNTFDVKKGDSPGFRKTLGSMIEKGDQITADEMATIIYDKVPCNPIAVEYNALQGVLGSVRAYGLDKKTEEKARNLTLDYIRKKSDSPGTLIEQMIQITLLKRLVDEGYLKVTEMQTQKIASLKKEGEAIRNELRSHSEGAWPDTRDKFMKLGEGEQKKFLDHFSLELKKTELLRRDLVKVVKDL